ncbi:TlpA disulfide reductase family protein [Pedobacter zeae]|uniref:Peroxiredoxin n=1 Tax=Pedobacter zeae TaxID=1737356 RepID=A0A7W6KBH2_9SPHI|nr:TlpA disulfide reductase family protein [Pedobacter zeae]MBB4107537.1 peroxiredoxin [Pedobacter zeae]GGG98695.1 thiol:disulfide interchange protein [Pedobacter zeae]
MKKTLLAAVAVLPLAALAQKPFSLNGTLKNDKGNEKIYLSYSKEGKTFLDSTELKNGTFAFKGEIGDPLRASVYKKPAEKNGKRDFLSIYLEPANIQLVSADSLKNASISGSKVNADNEKLKALTKPVQDKLAAINSEFGKLTAEQRKDKALTEAIYKRYETASKELEPIYIGFARSNPQSYVSLSAISQIATSESAQPEAEKAYAALSQDLKDSKSGRDISTYFNAVKNTKIGLRAIDFTQNDVNDKPVKLSDFKGKYVLVDFWASWCGPCRQENPNVVAAYNQYKDKGFTVLGVSLDQPGKKEAWLKAIADDQLAWTHVSDLKFWDNAVAKQYGIRSIPANFLIDPNGKIVAKGLRGEALKEKLASLLDAKTK